MDNKTFLLNKPAESISNDDAIEASGIQEKKPIVRRSVAVRKMPVIEDDMYKQIMLHTKINSMGCRLWTKGRGETRYPTMLFNGVKYALRPAVYLYHHPGLKHLGYVRMRCQESLCLEISHMQHCMWTHGRSENRKTLTRDVLEQIVRNNSTLMPSGCRTWSGPCNVYNRPVIALNSTYVSLRGLLYKEYYEPDVLSQDIQPSCSNPLCVEHSHLFRIKRLGDSRASKRRSIKRKAAKMKKVAKYCTRPKARPAKKQNVASRQGHV